MFGVGLTEYLARWHKGALVALGVALMVLVCLGDRFTSPVFEVSIFYTIPVSFFSWFFHRRAGLAAAAVSATMLLTTNNVARDIHTHRGTTYWNVRSPK
jgi:hypothetical protein